MNPSPRASNFGHVLNLMLLLTLFHFYCAVIDIRFLFVGAINAIVWLVSGYFAPSKPTSQRLR